MIRNKEDYLDKYVFCGLKNLNTGFDVESIKYFSEKDFRVVLKRIKELGLGINGIEPWLDGVFYDVLVVEDFGNNPMESNWYMKVFNYFRKQNKNLQYAATYYVPSEKLEIK